MFGFVRSALLRLTVDLCWVDRCFGSWVLLGLSCLDEDLLRVTLQQVLLPNQPTTLHLILVPISTRDTTWAGRSTGRVPANMGELGNDTDPQCVAVVAL